MTGKACTFNPKYTFFFEYVPDCTRYILEEKRMYQVHTLGKRYDPVHTCGILVAKSMYRYIVVYRSMIP